MVCDHQNQFLKQQSPPFWWWQNIWVFIKNIFKAQVIWICEALKELCQEFNHRISWYTNFNELTHLAQTIYEWIREFLKIVLIQSKSSSFLYGLDYFDYFKTNLPLSYIKSVYKKIL